MPATVNVMADAVVVNILAALSAAATANATSTGFDLTGYEGDVLIVVNVGALTGSFTNVRVQGSVDNSVWNDLAAGGVIQATAAANTSYGLAIDVRKMITTAGNCRYLRVLGTIATGPVLLSYTLAGFKKHS